MTDLERIDAAAFEAIRHYAKDHTPLEIAAFRDGYLEGAKGAVAVVRQIMADPERGVVA